MHKSVLIQPVATPAHVCGKKHTVAHLDRCCQPHRPTKGIRFTAIHDARSVNWPLDIGDYYFMDKPNYNNALRRVLLLISTCSLCLLVLYFSLHFFSGFNLLILSVEKTCQPPPANTKCHPIYYARDLSEKEHTEDYIEINDPFIKSPLSVGDIIKKESWRLGYILNGESLLQDDIDLITHMLSVSIAALGAWILLTITSKRKIT